MNKYRIVFHGRKIGSLGMSSFQCLDIEADNEQSARAAAYVAHEHIWNGLDGVQVIERKESNNGLFSAEHGAFKKV